MACFLIPQDEKTHLKILVWGEKKKNSTSENSAKF